LPKFWLVKNSDFQRFWNRFQKQATERFLCLSVAFIEITRKTCGNLAIHA